MSVTLPNKQRLSLGVMASRMAPNSYRKYLDWAAGRQRERVTELLARPGTPAVLPAGRFDQLLAERFARAAPYDYDAFSATTRAGGRLQRLAKLLPELKRPQRILEVSCGDGLVGKLLSHGGHEVVLTDMRDWRSAPARDLPFVAWNACESPCAEFGSFDLVLAYNATEHWERPDQALANLLGLCRAGGQVLLDFGPLFNSPWGLHAWDVGFPYPQFLFDRELIVQRVREMGVGDLGQQSDALQPTNGWSVGQFRALWRQCGAEVRWNFEDRDERYLDFIERHAASFCGRGLALEDVTINSIEILLRNPGAGG